MKIDLERLEGLVRDFAGCRVGVAGDLIADIYQFGSPARLSREAPVLVVRCREERVLPGSAANSAMNLAALGGGVALVGLLGEDGPGRTIREALSRAGIDGEGILSRDGWTTVAKTRVMVGEPGRTPQQVVRLDREPGNDPPGELDREVQARIDRIDRRVAGWLVSDYEYGLVSLSVAEGFVARAAAGRRVVVDSRHHLGRFRGVEAICPNRGEAERLVGHPLEDREDLVAGGREILSRLDPAVLFLTLGNEGMAIFTRDGVELFLPVVGPDEVTDVSGAGDTVAATILLARCVGADPLEAGILATCAASVVVQRLGAAAVGREELIRTLRSAAPQLEGMEEP